MRKYFTVLLLAVAMMAGGFTSMEAKTKKKSKARTSHSSRHYYTALDWAEYEDEPNKLILNGDRWGEGSVYVGRKKVGDYYYSNGAYIVNYSISGNMEGWEIDVIYGNRAYFVVDGDWIYGNNLVTDNAFDLNNHYMYRKVKNRKDAITFDASSKTIIMHTTKGTNRIKLSDLDSVEVKFIAID